MRLDFLQNKTTVYLLIVLVCYGVYGNSIQNEYSLDDELVIENNEITQGGIKNIPSIFSQYSFINENKDLAFSYRPITLSSFAIEVSLFGVSPHVSHFINILLYAVFCCFLYYFLSIAFPNISYVIIGLTLLLFIVHPIHTEVVNNIKSRDTLLVSLFGMAALIQLVKFISSRNILRLVAVLFFTTMGLLSKESFTIYLLLLFFLYFLIEKKSEISIKNICFVIIGVFGSLMVVSIIHSSLITEGSAARQMLFYENPLVNESFLNRIPTGVYTSLFYLKLLIWPATLSFYYGYNEIPILGWDSPVVYIGLVIYILIIFSLIKYFKTSKFILCGGIFFILTAAASSNIYLPLPGIVAERFMFIGSIGFVMIFTYLLNHLYLYFINSKKFPKKIYINYVYFSFITLLFVAYSSRTISRNADWKNYTSLFLNDVKHLEKSVKANDMASFHILTLIKAESNPVIRKQLSIEGIQYAKQCIKYSPEHPQCWNNLGTLYFNEENYQKAEECYANAILFTPKPSVDAFFNLGLTYQVQGKVKQAKESFEKAIRIDPELHNLIPTYKLLVTENKLEKNSIPFLEKISNSDAQSYTIELLLVDLYNNEQNYDGILKHLKKAFEIQPTENIGEYIEKVEKYLHNNKQL